MTMQSSCCGGVAADNKWFMQEIEVNIMFAESMEIMNLIWWVINLEISVTQEDDPAAPAAAF